MIDRFGRNINYLRISVTDRCNLRCCYCMPDGIVPIHHCEVLRFEEFLRLVRLFAVLGVEHVRVTGGEPLVRRGVVDFIAELKRIPGIRTVSMTTNGVLLAESATALKDAGLDSVNISLDTTDEALAEKITGCRGVFSSVLKGIDSMRELNIPVKLNAVLLKDTAETLRDLAGFAERGIPLRLIELMPMGYGKVEDGLTAEDALSLLKEKYPDLHPVEKHIGLGPAHYYESVALSAPIGIIDAMSHRFCAGCNRVRLTSTGVLKPCLCFEEGVALGEMLRTGADDKALTAAIEGSIYGKPRQHCFDTPQKMTESKLMSQIGG